MSKSDKSFKKFMIIWAGEWISSIGSGLTAFAMGIYIFQLTKSAACVSLVTLCAFLPIVLLNPLTGVLADRYDRRLMMILGDAGSALGLAYILITIVLCGHVELWQIYLGVTVSSVFASLLDPAYKATVTDLLTEEQFAKASGLVQLASSSKYLLSPVIAGLLLMVVDIKTILIIDISTFAIAVFAVLGVKRNLKAKPVSASGGIIKELAEGWKALSAEKGVILLVALMSVVTFSMGFLQTLFTPMLLPISDAKTLGIGESICAVGMVVTSLLIGVFAKKPDLIKILTLGLCGAGMFMALTGCSDNIIFIIAAGFLFFASLPLVQTGAEVMIRTHIDNAAQGRAWGLIGILSQLGYIVAYGISGILADRVFNPLLLKNGPLASSVGRIIGTGTGRGIGIMFIICGLIIVASAFIIPNIKAVKRLNSIKTVE